MNPPGLNDPSDYGYTQAVVVPSGAKLVYIAGQGGADENGKYGNFATQLKQAFANLRTALTAVGATPEDVVKITILSVNHNEEKLRLISAQRKSFWLNHKPASTLIPVPRLASDEMLFEIDAVAVIPNS
ncbi:RidA family protein [Hyella patelloides]|nr:RidA family protein [Hyella patelloides]